MGRSSGRVERGTTAAEPSGGGVGAAAVRASSGLRQAAGGWYGLTPADVRRNFLVNLTDNVLFAFGYSLVAPPTMLSLYVSYLTTSNLLISLTPALAGLGWALPQLFAARWVMGLRIKKWYSFKLAIPGRLALLALTLTTIFVARDSPEVAVALTLLFVFLYRLTSGFITPAWTDMIAKAIPGTIRGRWYGTAQFIGGALGAVALVGARSVLDGYPFPLNFAIVFGVATLFISGSILFTVLTREPPSQARTPPPFRAYMASLPEVARRDPHYVRYLFGRLLLMLSTLAVPFIAVYAVRRFGVDAGEAALFTSALTAAQTLGMLGWGWLIDRSGSKRVLELAGLAGALAAGLALVAPTSLWLIPAFALVGVSTGGFQAADGNIVIELAPPDDRPRYVGLTNTALAPFQLLSPLLGGLIADRLGYQPTFGVACALGLAGVLLLLRFVADPRRRG